MRSRSGRTAFHVGGAAPTVAVVAVYRRIVGTLLVLGATVLASLTIHDLVVVGTCGAPPGAIAARPCPEGTGGDILVLLATIFVVPLLGVAVARSWWLVVPWWCLLWLGMGTAALVADGHPDTPDDGGALEVAITFLAIGGLSTLGAFGLLWAKRAAT